MFDVHYENGCAANGDFNRECGIHSNVKAVVGNHLFSLFAVFCNDVNNVLNLIVIYTDEESGVSAHKKTAGGGKFGYGISCFGKCCGNSAAVIAGDDCHDHFHIIVPPWEDYVIFDRKSGIKLYFTTFILLIPYFMRSPAIFSSMISPGTARAMQGGQGRLSLAAILPTAFSVAISSVSAKTAEGSKDHSKIIQRFIAIMSCPAPLSPEIAYHSPQMVKIIINTDSPGKKRHKQNGNQNNI